MKQFNYKGYQVEIYEGYCGDEVFITKGGFKIYSARVCKGQGMDRVKSKLG